MSKRCEITGVGPRTGHSVSHSMRHTKRRWLPNLKSKRIYLAEDKKWITVRLSAAALKTITKKGVTSLAQLEKLK